MTSDKRPGSQWLVEDRDTTQLKSGKTAHILTGTPFDRFEGQVIAYQSGDKRAYSIQIQDDGPLILILQVQYGQEKPDALAMFKDFMDRVHKFILDTRTNQK